MPERVRKRSEKAGLPPGTLIHIGERRAEKVKITLIDYDETQFQEKEVERVEDCFPFKAIPTVTWLNIDGLHNVEVIEKIGKQFSFHPLLLEDILNTHQRPKLEDYEHYLYIVLKMLYYEASTGELTAEQVSLILGAQYVISFQERGGELFRGIRDRIRNAKGRIRKAGADYLAYTLLDVVVDSYFGILEQIEEKIEEVEEELVINPTPETLQRIHRLKRELILLSKSVWPLREVIGGLQRAESPLIHAPTNIYLRDVYDHTIQIIEGIETFREMVTGMVDIYLSSMSNKMNEVIKVLTIIATVFIPLTFIAGIYGMNFKYMPELEWRWGYPFVWLVIGMVVILMLLFFKRKKWL